MDIMKRWVFVFVLLVLIVMPGAYGAVGVSPSSYLLDFEPGMKRIFDFRFYTDSEGSFFKMSLEGGLADYAVLSTDELEGTGIVRVSLSLPEKLENPGLNTLMVVGEQVIGESVGFGLTGIVKAPIWIRVPYPGKYLVASLGMSNANQGEKVGYSLNIDSLGEEDVVAIIVMDVYREDSKVDSVNLGTKSIGAGESIEIEGELDSTKYLAARYNAVVTIDYGGEDSVVVERVFRVGELFVDVINHSNYFVRDKINRFEIEVESFWNGPIENIFAEVSIEGYPEKIFLTPSITLGGFEQGLLTGFFDTTGIEERKFQGKIDVHYLGKVTEKIVDLEFGREVNYLLIAIVVALVIIVILIILFVMFILKVRKSKKEKK